jgi:CubicO group peptidase (beta-lactamase class C family)
MKIILLFIIAGFTLVQPLFSSEIYFPPADNNNWESVSPEELNWNTEKIPGLLEFIEEKNSKAFLVLKDGRIVIEKYFGSFTRDSLWYWASAGKTLTAATVGIAQEEGLLSIDDKTSDYLGTGWTSLAKEKEDLITIRHQLTMSSGLDDGVANRDCWEPECLQYLEDAGERWAYHNAPYTLLEQVVESAAGQTYNQFFFGALRNKIGMDGAWIKARLQQRLFQLPSFDGAIRNSDSGKRRLGGRNNHLRQGLHL